MKENIQELYETCVKWISELTAVVVEGGKFID